MILYFSSPTSSEPVITNLKVPNILLSFGVDAPRRWQYYTQLESIESVLIDSGAFSIYNSGRNLTMDDYLEFILKIPETIPCISFDVIPKDTNSLKEVDRCAEMGVENYLYLSSKRKNILPVYHTGENLKYLKKYCSLTDHVCASPLRGNNISYDVYYDSVFSITKDRIKVHGLGVTIPNILYKYPFYSVDSTTYLRCQIIKGKTYIGTNKLIRPLLYRSIRYWMNIEKQATNLWEERGIKWN